LADKKLSRDQVSKLAKKYYDQFSEKVLAERDKYESKLNKIRDKYDYDEIPDSECYQITKY
jgi:hypothetical protein